MTAAYDDVIKRWTHEPVDETWKDLASCRGTSPELWFPVRGDRRRRDIQILTKAAKSICKECPVQRDCLDYAITMDERWGIYGGLTERERAVLKRRSV